MEKAFARVYLKKGCANCDRVTASLDEKKYHVERRFIDETPEMAEELSRETGRTVVPALNAAGRWIQGDPDAIIHELDTMALKTSCESCK